MSPTIHNINNAIIKEKMASFDYDWTIVNPKDGKTFPSSIDDWVWLYPGVPEKIKQYYEDGYMIVVFTNQSKKWKCEQIQMVMKQLEIPLFVVIATDKTEYKPNPILFNTPFGGNINKEESFFVGDALGLWYPGLDHAFPVTPPRYNHALALESLDRLAALDTEWLHYTHFGPRAARDGTAIAQVRREFEAWLTLIAEGIATGEDAAATTERLLAERPGLTQTEVSMGLHQAGTHLGSVRGMRGWLDAQL